jgi:hypothetical protein
MKTRNDDITGSDRNDKLFGNALHVTRTRLVTWKKRIPVTRVKAQGLRQNCLK